QGEYTERRCQRGNNPLLLHGGINLFLLGTNLLKRQVGIDRLHYSTEGRRNGFRAEFGPQLECRAEIEVRNLPVRLVEHADRPLLQRPVPRITGYTNNLDQISRLAFVRMKMCEDAL